MLGLGSALSTSSIVEGSYSLSLDGTGDYLDIGPSVYNDTEIINWNQVWQTDFTIALWVKLTDGITGNHQYFLGSQNAANEDNISFMCRATTGNLHFYFESDNDIYILESDAAVFVDGQNDWKHVAVVIDYSGSGNIAGTMYVDGSAIAATEDAALVESNGIHFASDIPLFIGALNNNGAVASPMTGLLDEVVIRDKGTSGADMETLYRFGTDLRNGLVDSGGILFTHRLHSYLRMNEGSGTHIAEFGYGAFNAYSSPVKGTLAADATFSTDTPHPLII